jgi:predicted CXXCH cytochrome family protein
MPSSRPSARAAVLAIAMVLALAPQLARAFHEGGAGECDGCHTIHSAASGSSFLLTARDPSSVCLTCHADTVQRPYTVMTTGLMQGLPPLNYTPGGDFGWLRKTYQWIDAKGLPQTSRGDSHGHNVVAADFGLFPDTQHQFAPGGTYASDKLACISCHDPHGAYRITDTAGTVSRSGAPIRTSGSYTAGATVEEPTATSSVGVYRLLGGAGYQYRSSGQLAFSASPPVAVAPPAYNRSERTTQVRVAYGAGMVDWCSNCHGAFHTAFAPGNLLHPTGAAGRLSATVSKVYNSYVKTGDLTGMASSSYSSLVPFEEGTPNRASLAPHARSDLSASAGPQTGLENVSCLTCHRAHASGWDHAMRWNQKTEYIAAAGQWPGVDAGGVAATAVLAQGRTTAETRGAMYDREPTAYTSFQNSLCNKCHAK